MDKIILEASGDYKISNDEVRRMCITLALSRYTAYCKPEYDEKRLLLFLRRDVNMFVRIANREFSKKDTKALLKDVSTFLTLILTSIESISEQ